MILTFHVVLMLYVFDLYWYLFMKLMLGLYLFAVFEQLLTHFLLLYLFVHASFRLHFL